MTAKAENERKPSFNPFRLFYNAIPSLKRKKLDGKDHVTPLPKVDKKDDLTPDKHELQLPKVDKEDDDPIPIKEVDKEHDPSLLNVDDILEGYHRLPPPKKQKVADQDREELEAIENCLVKEVFSNPNTLASVLQELSKRGYEIQRPL